MLMNIARGSTHQTFSMEDTSVATKVVMIESLRALAIFCTNKIQNSSAVIDANLGSSDFFTGNTASEKLLQALLKSLGERDIALFKGVGKNIVFFIENTQRDSRVSVLFSQVWQRCSIT